MLVLTRKVGESIVIGDVVIRVVSFKGQQQVRIGIDAPSDVPIRRGELEERPPEEREPAAA